MAISRRPSDGLSSLERSAIERMNSGYQMLAKLSFEEGRNCSWLDRNWRIDPERIFVAARHRGGLLGPGAGCPGTSALTHWAARCQLDANAELRGARLLPDIPI
jgi:hypothetical protein